MTIRAVILVICMMCLLAEASFGAEPSSRPPKLTEKDMAVQVRQFAALLASKDCETRASAIFEQLPKIKTIPRHVFEQESASDSEVVKSKVANLLGSLEREEKAGTEFETLVKTWLSPALKAEAAEKANRFVIARNNLLAIAKSESEPFIRRQAAVGVMEFFVDQYDDPDGEARRQGLPLAEWRSALTALLKSEDVRLRSLVAGVIGQSSTFSETDEVKLFAILIQSLRDDDLSSRVLAQKALAHMTSQRFCIDPTDSPDNREAGIQQWEIWLKGMSPLPAQR
jgi:hypothetical protein